MSRWIIFAELRKIVSEQIGSDVLAINEIRKLLRSGELRSMADRSDIHDLTGEIMRTYQHELEADWWEEEGRFRRSAIKNQVMLCIPWKSCRILDGGFKLYNPFAYDNVRFWYGDLSRIYNLEKTEPSRRKRSGQIRQRGPKPSVKERVKAAMRGLPRSELIGLKEEAMATTFQASRDTCRRARDEILAPDAER